MTIGTSREGNELFKLFIYLHLTQSEPIIFLLLKSLSIIQKPSCVALIELVENTSWQVMIKIAAFNELSYSHLIS